MSGAIQSFDVVCAGVPVNKYVTKNPKKQTKKCNEKLGISSSIRDHRNKK